ncbi:hypothetical protein COC42_09105 [Sphingomonas spermidinifaciens]|uniref:DUF429 domain-containing protein n=1 Tax=Sphingomonas spermidinifaciens TaxID=1141889 RepID=A0A2A4B8Y1_9SPHN|nr:hypothetical protein [Sphingomonas spermidinifaciens]PCD04412.1 hypothetical protein COC42_09105 [Sphingomonas spermidinifaciens]
MVPAPDRFGHFVGIDWSGAAGERQRGIAVAICAQGKAVPTLVRPGHVWSRMEVLDWLSSESPDDAIVGLDLGASLPFADMGAFFPGWVESPHDAHALWALIDGITADDPHLSASSFVDHPEVARHLRRHGGRKGEHFSGRGRLRLTEVRQREQGLNPYSNLNLVGAAQVGKSSLTGMRVLHRLPPRIAIWPFDTLPMAGPVVLEIYTSLAAVVAGRPKGRAKMRDHAALDAALTVLGSEPTRGTGPIDDHKSDAILTAAWLRRDAHRPELWTPRDMTPQIAATEGWTFGIT